MISPWAITKILLWYFFLIKNWNSMIFIRIIFSIILKWFKSNICSNWHENFKIFFVNFICGFNIFVIKKFIFLAFFYRNIIFRIWNIIKWSLIVLIRCGKTFPIGLFFRDRDKIFEEIFSKFIMIRISSKSLLCRIWWHFFCISVVFCFFVANIWLLNIHEIFYDFSILKNFLRKLIIKNKMFRA